MLKGIDYLLIIATLLFSPAHSLELDIELHGLINSKGNILLSVCEKAQFLKNNSASPCVFSVVIPSEKGDISVRTTDIPPGVYAIAVVHDENENEELDFNLFGIPLEGYGFSNQSKALRSQPDFDNFSFRLTNGMPNVTKHIELRY